MAKFIEVQDVKNQTFLIRVNQISCLASLPERDDSCVIYLSRLEPIVLGESYNSVKEKIEKS
jgi:hypothetical protein